MGFGLIGAYSTYRCYKDTLIGFILSPSPEPAIKEVALGKVVFNYFIDNDFEAGETFNDLFNFLHYNYFPKLT